jgi:hypothetical protein
MKLRRMFGPKRKELKESWRNIHNEEFHNFSLPNISAIKSNRMKRTGPVERVGDMANAYTNLVRKPEGKTPLGRLRC